MSARLSPVRTYETRKLVQLQSGMELRTKLAVFLTTILERIRMPHVLGESTQLITTIEGMDVTLDDVL